MQLVVSHALPGRVRLRFPALCRCREALALAGAALARLSGVRHVRMCVIRGSLLVTFDPTRLSVRALLLGLGAGSAHREVAATTAPALPAAPPAGLRRDQVKQLQARYGMNRLPDEPTVPFWRRFLGQFQDLRTVILLTGTALSAVTGRFTETLAVGAVTLLSALIGAWREGRRDQALTLLQSLTPSHATVIREGRVAVIDAVELVPGDLILLRKGDRVPADVIVLSAADLAVDDSRLPGVEEGAQRHILGVAGGHLPVGSEVVRGRARAAVVATGTGTVIGHVAASLGQVARLPSPVERRMSRLAQDLLKVSLVAISLVVASGLLRGLPLVDVLASGISMAAAAIPEGLPAFVTLALASGARRLARRGAYVRDVSAAEGVGSVDMICTDKTGTLTRGQMTVRTLYTGGHWWTVTGTGYEATGAFLRGGTPKPPLEDPDLRRFLEAALHCNNATLEEGEGGRLDVIGSHTEGALLVLALKAGLHQEPDLETRVEEEPFDPNIRRMTVTIRKGEPTRMTCSKGAPESVLPLCTRMLRDGKVHPLDAGARAAITQAVSTMTASAYRVLALSFKIDEETEKGFVFAGLVGIVDPPRSEIKPVIRRLAAAGVRTVMLTGDHPETAAAVARELGLLDRRREVVTGPQLRALKDWQLARIADRVAVYARVTPNQKARVIRILQGKGHTVAFAGDGIDDAPAIRAADIGVAPRDRGADVAREAAAIILADDRFEALAAAVEQGRSIAANVDEIARYLLTANMAQILAVLASAVFGMPLVLLPLHLLWLNVVADLPAAVALGERHLPVTGNMPRRGAPVQALERDILASGLQLGAAAFGLYATSLAGGATLQVARTMAFSALAFGHVLYLFRCRTDMGTPCGLWFPSEPILSLAAGASGLLLLATVYFPPLAAALGTAPLSVGQWAGVVSAALAGNLSAVAGFSLKRSPRVLPV